jgi:signal transduction histidine kinase/CheY-like chemotaxis protein
MPRSRIVTVPLFRHCCHWLKFVIVGLVLAFGDPGVANAETPAQPEVFTDYERLNTLPESGRQVLHPIRFELVVDYYDPGWGLLWFEEGDYAGFMQCAGNPLPIKAGQRVLIEGMMSPAAGLHSDQAKVTVLSASEPRRPAVLTGAIDAIHFVGVRLVTLEAYVNRQTKTDFSHLTLEMVAGGYPTVGQILVSGEGPLPQLEGAFIRARGVLVPGRDAAKTPTLALWIAGPQDVEILSRLRTDPRFNLPATLLEVLPNTSSGSLVRVTGTVMAWEPGKWLRIGDGTGQVEVLTGQDLPVRIDERVEAIGYPLPRGTGWALREGWYRRMRPSPAGAPEITSQSAAPQPVAAAPEDESEKVITSTIRFWEQPDAFRQEPQHVRFEFVVRYFDPAWNLLWAESEGKIEYISRGIKSLSLKAGQRILVDGQMSTAEGLSFEKAKVTVLAENVAPAVAVVQKEIGDFADKGPGCAELEGYLNRQAEVDSEHLLFEMTVGTQVIYARILLPIASAVPQLENAYVRARGVLVPSLDPAGKVTGLALWIAQLEDVKVLGRLQTDPQFNIPVTPIEALLKISADTLVRVDGTVRSQEPGRSLTLRDDTGQVEVLTGLTFPLQTGERVEAIGYPRIRGTEWTLRKGLYRKEQAGGAREVAALSGEGLPKLRLAEKILDLGTDEAARGYPVQLYGVVTWSHPAANFFYLQDTSGGVCVSIDPARFRAPHQGDSAAVKGVSSVGEFAPLVQAASMEVTGALDLPRANTVTLEQVLTGIEEGQWVELGGYLRQVGQDGIWTRLELTTSAGEFAAYLPPTDKLASLQGAVVRLRGVCTAIANGHRQLTGIRVWVPAPEFVQLEEAASADPFAVPIRSIASLRQFSTLLAFSRRTRVAGVVLHHAPGHYAYIQDGAESLQVLSRDLAPLAPGDRVEAVGFPGREGSRVVLREAVFRRTAAGPEPTPISLDDPERIDEAADGHLVRVVGTLLDSTTRPKDSQLMIQTGNAIFEALLDHEGAGSVRGRWLSGSRLALTGVYQIEFDEYRHPRAYKIQLRSPRDIQVLRRPSWLTAERTLAATGVLAVVSMLGIGWVTTLRRRVRRQTEQIRTQLEKESRLEAELQRSSRLESLGLLAGGIAHDFNNLLTVIMGNLTLAKLDSAGNPLVTPWLQAAEQGGMRARDLTMQLLTFAKGGDPVRKAVVLSDVVREVAEFALHGSKVRCEFEIEADLWPADVDKGQIGQVVQNIIINGVQAMPQGGTIRVTLGNALIAAGAVADLVAGRYLKLCVTDSGVGIKPEFLPHIFDPYFTTKPQGNGLGLATVYSIVKKHLGRIEVDSKPDQGTTFRIWLPAAQGAPAAAVHTSELPTKLSGRVLVMDDDEAIRQSATALLRRMGLEASAVRDGAEVLREYPAAQAAGRPFDLVILDLTVPGGMGGRETIEKLRQLDPHVRAVVSSGYSSDPVLAQYRSFGFLGMVPKPYDLTELTKVIHAVLQGRGT